MSVAETTPTQADVDFGERMREATVAVRLRRTKLGVSRTLTADQRSQAAATFDANPDYVRGSKRLLNSRDERIRAITTILQQAEHRWKSMTVPYPVDGIRLMDRAKIPEFEAAMTEQLDALSDAVAAADEVLLTEIIPDAQRQLQHLFNRNDYPDSLIGCFALDWEYPSVEPPDYLRELNPRLFAQEQERIAARFEEAVRLTEQQFADEFSKLVARLVERMTPQQVDHWTFPTPADLGEEAALAVSAAQRQLADQDGSEERDEDALRAAISEAVRGDIRRRIDELDASRLIEDTDAKQEQRDRLATQLDLESATSIQVRPTREVGYPAEVRVRIKQPRKAEAKTSTHRFETMEEAADWLRSIGCAFAKSETEHKQFKSSSVENLTEFFERFREMNVGSNAELDQLVERAKRAVSGREVGRLREDATTRDEMRRSLESVAESLDSLLVNRPRRRITLDDDE